MHYLPPRTSVVAELLHHLPRGDAPPWRKVMAGRQDAGIASAAMLLARVNLRGFGLRLVGSAGFADPVALVHETS